MGFHRRIFIFLAIFSLLGLSACSEANFKEQFSFENSSPEIRFENFDPSSGDIQASEMISDPLRKTYAKGVWDGLDQGSFKINAVRSTSTPLNRVNFVFVGDGYTAADLSVYAQDVSANTERLLAQQPFKAYKNYFAFHRVDVVSTESGVSIVGEQTKTTALGMQYGCEGVARLLCINLSKASAAAAKAPKVDVIFALANSDRYGGAGYSSPAVATLAGRNIASSEVALHELGHSFAKLSDEYETAAPPYDCAKSPNTSLVDKVKIAAQKVKWFRWLDLSHIGAFPGSCYSTKYFRPTDNSKMRTLNRPFEEVNTEQFIFQIYNKVKPIEFATPTATFKTHQVLQVIPMIQEETPLEIVWAVNGKIIEASRNRSSLNTANLGLSKGTHKIVATVTDRTTRVRDEAQRTKLMSQSIDWTLKL